MLNRELLAVKLDYMIKCLLDDDKSHGSAKMLTQLQSLKIKVENQINCSISEQAMLNWILKNVRVTNEGQ
jgi:hypothetical protein